MPQDSATSSANGPAADGHTAGQGQSAPGGAGRLGFAQVTPVVAFPVLGSVLAVLGMSLAEIFQLLGGCAGIGAAAVVAISGWRRLAAAVARGLLAASK